MKHTPGPWFVVAEDGLDFTAIPLQPKLPTGKNYDPDFEVLGSSEWLRAISADLKLIGCRP